MESKTKIDVKHQGVVIGYVYDNDLTNMVITNDEHWNSINKPYMENNIFISSRRMGTINESGIISEGTPTEFSIYTRKDLT
jgi:hypothetical protein